MKLLVSLLVAAAFSGLVGLGGAAASGPASPALQQASGPTSLNYRYYDFFNVPYGEWWDYRYSVYGDLPMNAECFNATSIVDGVCFATDPAVKDVSTYPYTNWYPLPGNIRPGHAFNNPMVYAPYRFDVAGAYVPGYDLSDPVFLPVLNPAASPGASLAFDWNLNYLDKRMADGLSSAGCGRLTGSMDGFIIRSQVSLTMDLQESRRLFGVAGTSVADARAWWSDAVMPGCLIYGSLEDTVELWFVDIANSKYDIVNSFEYAYTPFFTAMSASVGDDGTTSVTLDHVAWGTDVLMARIFYWGRAAYDTNYLDSTQKQGWWGMELAWFEGMKFRGRLAESWFNFTLNSAMQYHFQQGALPGPNGIFDKTDDVPYWTWGPILSDYTNDYTPTHQLSELDRYPSPPYSYVHSTPGSPSSFYGQAAPYDYAPITWDLAAGETRRYEFPTTPVVFYDPNLTPYGADPTLGQYVELVANLGFEETFPAAFGTYDSATGVWSITGPTASGGPAGSPGADGIPGTADDQYALQPWGSIVFTAFRPPVELRLADLTGRSAWPERHHWVTSKDVDGAVGLFAKAANLGTIDVRLAVIFTITDGAGNTVTIQSAEVTIAPGQTMVIQDAFTPMGMGKYYATAQVLYDNDGSGVLDTLGTRLKSFSFSVVP